MENPATRAQQLPSPPESFHTLLTASKDTHEARANVLYVYDAVLLCVLESADDYNKALSTWTTVLQGCVSTPPGFFDDVWQELMERRDELIEYIYTSQRYRGEEALFSGLRVEDHTHFLLEMLQSGYNGQCTDFVTKLVEEQPQYFDRPSDVDGLIRQRTDTDSFPALTDMLSPVPATEDSKAALTVIGLLVHHISYMCDLFQKTDFTPSAQVVEAFAGYRINQLSRMFADTASHIPLRTRIHCASINHRSIQDFVVLRAKELLQSTDAEFLNWHMYTWLLRCVERTFLGVAGTAKLLGSFGLDEVVRVDVSERSYYAPSTNTGLTVPERIIQEWQDYDPAELSDVEFEAAGPRILVKNVAKPVQPSTGTTCTVCLESFADRNPSTVAWRVGCGHTFHAQCLKV